MERLPNTYDAVGDSLASPLTSHLLAYNSAPVSTAIAVPRGIKKTPASDSPAPVEQPVTVAVNGSGIEASMGLNQSVSLTGLPNSPGTASGANSPGLSNEPEGESGNPANGGKAMLFWALIIAVIIGLIWYFNPGNILNRTA